MWFWIIVIGLAVIIVIPRLQGQNAEKRAGYGPRCRHCGARMKYNADRTGWRRTCRKCGRDQ